MNYCIQSYSQELYDNLKPEIYSSFLCKNHEILLKYSPEKDIRLIKSFYKNFYSYTAPEIKNIYVKIICYGLSVEKFSLPTINETKENLSESD